MAEPVTTSRSSHIGGHEIVEEIGAITVKHYNWFDTQDEKPDGWYKEESKGFLAGTEYTAYWDSEAEAIAALKEKAREKDANGIINLQTHHDGQERYWDKASGIAVMVEPK